ncbi:TPR-like protein, partial [Polyplosphaeria fusca]
LPLALNQITTYIQAQVSTLEEFVPLHKKRMQKIHTKRPIGFDSELTVATIWTIVLRGLSGDSAVLQRLLAFFDPDGIEESILQRGAERLLEESDSKVEVNSLEFLTDELDFNDAKVALFRASLIDRNAATRSLSFHRLLQSTVLNELNASERSQLLRLSINLLTAVFPSSWADDATGYVFKEWQRCNFCLPHAICLGKQFANEAMEEAVVHEFMELLFRAAWFLYETEGYSDYESLIKTCLLILAKNNLTETISYASAINMLGLVEIDLGLPIQALAHFKQGLELRKKHSTADHWGIAVSLSNIGFAYVELGDIEKANEYHDQAMQFRRRINCRLINNSISNLASLYLRKGDPEEAERMYRTTPGMENFKDEDFICEDMPRYAGDLVLISTVREAQGKDQEALDKMMMVLEYHRRKTGPRFKTCFALCRIAKLLNNLRRPTAAL